MQLSQPTLEPHMFVLYLLSTSCVLTLASSLLFPLGYAAAAQFLPTRGSSLSATRTTRTSRRSSPSQRPCGALLSFEEFLSYLYFASVVSDIFVIHVINNICTHFIISFYVICAVIYCSFCCIYVLLDPGMYMIPWFMSFCKPGVTCDDTGLREEWETELVSKFIPASVHAGYGICVQ